MKKYLFLVLHCCFYITSLLFLPKEITLFGGIFLISIFALENIIYIALPLVLCFYLPLPSIFLLLSVGLIHILLYPFLKKNRFYALGVYLLSTLSAFVVFIILFGYSHAYLKIMLFLLVLYSIINLLYVYQKIEDKIIRIPYNSKLITLTLLLGYLFLLYFNTNQVLLIYFLFIQLYLLQDFKYNLIFMGIYALLLGITKNNIANALVPTTISFFPPSLCFTLDYSNLLWIPFALYSFAVLLIHIKNQKINVENDYINTLFDEFNKYLDTINFEFNKNNELKEIKQQHLEKISTQYCNYCTKHTLCKTNMNKRYSFISAGILGLKQNIYDCPYYTHFALSHVSIEHINRSFEYSGIKSLGFELSYLYNQSISLKKEFQKFIHLLKEYSYTVLNLDINMASTSLYFSIELDMQKPIIESLLLKCAYKSFGEELMLKINKNKIYFFKKPQIKITYAHTVLAKEGNLMSGDNYFIKKDYNSSYIFALSDGMGSGYSAYTESSDALKMISNLSSYHFRIQTILKLLEDIYELKSNYDRYATLDFLNIDTANRKMHLYKMGSSTTYILHNNKLITYENQALPLKLDEVNSAYELDLFSGDYIFLLSDGIGDFIEPNEFYSLVQNTNQSADEACNRIIEYIKRKEKNNLKDDLSLIVIKAI